MIDKMDPLHNGTKNPAMEIDEGIRISPFSKIKGKISFCDWVSHSRRKKENKRKQVTLCIA